MPNILPPVPIQCPAYNINAVTKYSEFLPPAVGDAGKYHPRREPYLTVDFRIRPLAQNSRIWSTEGLAQHFGEGRQIAPGEMGVCRYRSFLPLLKFGLRSFHAIPRFRKRARGEHTLSRDPHPKPHNCFSKRTYCQCRIFPPKSSSSCLAWSEVGLK